MADNEIKIKVIVDDSQEKKYYSESESRRKKSTTAETEEERRKTAMLKAELNARYAQLRQALDRELEAEKQGNRLEIKEAIAKRKILESELRTFEAANRNSLSIQLADFKAAKQKELIEARKNLSEFRNAPKTNLRGAIGSEAYVSQLISAQKTMKVDSPEFMQTGLLIERYQTKLKEAGREVKSLSDQIAGKLDKSLLGVSASFLQTTASALGLTLGLQQVISFVAKSIQEFAKEEQSMRSLDASVVKITGQNQKLADSLEDYSQELQRNYNINDDAIRQQLAFLVIQGRSEKQIKEITNAAIDLSAAQGDLSDENVITNIGKLDSTYEGILGKLAKYDSRLKDLTPEQLRNGDAVRLLGEKYRGMADEIDKGSMESVRSVKILWNTFLEFAGSVFTREGALLKGVTTLNQNLKEGQGAWYSYSQAMKEAMGTLPLIGGEMSALIGTMQSLLGITGELQTAMREFKSPQLNIREMRKDFKGSYEDAIRSMVNGFGYTWDQARDLIDKEFPVLKDPEAVSGNRTTPDKGSKGKEEKKKEILNLIDLEKEKLSKLNKQLQANLGDIGSELQLRREILAVELEIFRLRTGQRIDLGKALEGRNSMALTNAGILPRTPFKNLRAGNDPRGDMSSEEIDRLLNGMEISFDDVRGYASQTSQFFESILSNAGLTDSAFGRILSAVNQVLNTGGSLFGMFDTFLSFIPGGSVAGGAIGAVAGGFNPMNSGMPTNNMRIINNQPIIIQGTLNGQKFLKKELRKYNVNKGAVTL